MIFHWHIPVIPHNIYATDFNLPRRKIPVIWKTNIRFIQFLAVDQQFPMTKFDPFALQSNYPLEKHDLSSSNPDGHYLVSFGSRKEVMQPPTEIEAPVVIGWLHAEPLNMKGDADMAKK
jgi:hypothetical protein